MNHTYHAYLSDALHIRATEAYRQLVKHHNTVGLDRFLGYLSELGFENDVVNNQITVWSRGQRSPFRARMIFEMQGPQDPMLVRNNMCVHKSQFYVCYYLDSDNVRDLKQEMDNAPDPVARARQELKDRASDQDPALRSRPISTRIT